jgi:hypothetical protein
MIAAPARIDRNWRGEIVRVQPFAYHVVFSSDARRVPDRVAKVPLL